MDSPAWSRTVGNGPASLGEVGRISSQAAWLVVVGALLVACGGTAAPSTALSANSAAATVICPDGRGVNSGTVDLAAGESGSDDVAGHAAQWARVTDFEARFPSARLTVQAGQKAATATFTDASGEVRAELTYAKAPQGWALEGLQYC